MNALRKRFSIRNRVAEALVAEYTQLMVRTIYGAQVAEKAKMLKAGESLTTLSGDVIRREE